MKRNRHVQIELFFIAIAIVLAAFWTKLKFDGEPLYHIDFDGALRPINTETDALHYFIGRFSLATCTSCILIAPVILMLRWRKSFFYFGEKIWYIESLILIVYLFFAHVIFFHFNDSIMPLYITISLASLASLMILTIIQIFYVFGIVIEKQCHLLAWPNGFAIGAVITFGIVFFSRFFGAVY